MCLVNGSIDFHYQFNRNVVTYYHNFLPSLNIISLHRSIMMYSEALNPSELVPYNQSKLVENEKAIIISDDN